MGDLFSMAAVTLAALFPIMNPIGAMPVFYSLTEGDTPEQRRAQAIKTAINVFALLVVFLFAGRYVMDVFGIDLAVMQIAGGLIVAHTAWGMVSPQPRLNEEEHQEGRDKDDISFTPMAMPLLAGPGAIGVTISLASRHAGAEEYVGEVIGIAAMAVLSLVALLLGERLIPKLGVNGIGALTRIFGFLILAIAVQLVADGIRDIV